ncbi:LuxR family transcriptional regulator [Saccharopolyspora rectivirgula]|uniref:LuxR family transcriptional regulator n=1 Tax=Saccharopolyspora rectivirgula TaxID=28042 RepID=A0A073BA84_9PSEU|nr:LuxR family transcriptional regulator [Saccharopolyspora rectivirgula]KEI44639.1 LuxR family transcriptional regulator [Saccharopolyspora rectivirgula]
MLSGYTEELSESPAAGVAATTRAPAVQRSVQAQVEARAAVASVARAAARTATKGGVLQVVHGAQRVGQMAYELQRGAKQLVQGVAKPPYAATNPLDSLEARKLAEGVQYQVIYDRSALAARSPQLDITTQLVARGEQARVIHVAPTKLVIVDNEIALLPLTVSTSTVESAVVIHNSAMLAAINRIFENLWRFAAPFTAEHDLPASDMQPTEEERWILSLLASGATDDTIGRLMGFSARTAHRRVRELIARLGVETRFQAGMQAVKLGWL